MVAKSVVDEIESALASPDWNVVRDAVVRAAELLRANGIGEVAERLGERFIALTSHPKWEVRRAVADSLQYLRHRSFDAAIAPLLKDSHAYVQSAAQRSRARRTELTRADVLERQHEDLLREMLSGVESRHNRRASQEARRIAEKYAEMFVREARHEIVKVIAPLDLALANVLDLLTVPVDVKRCRREVRRVIARIDLLASVIDSLNDFVATTAPEFHREDLRELLDESVALVKDKMPPKERRRFHITIRIADGLDVEVHKPRVIQAFSNIVQNALDAHPPKRRAFLSIAVRALPDQVVVDFADRGSGMSEEAQRDAFRLYGTSKEGGTGFGLPLARKIVESEHGGSIVLASAKGTGTTVTVTLPIEQEGRGDR